MEIPWFYSTRALTPATSMLSHPAALLRPALVLNCLALNAVLTVRVSSKQFA